MDDLISRKWLVECVEEGWIKFDTEKDENEFIHLVRDIAPSAQPYSEAELQKMQELEQAELQKAYECGRASAQPEIVRCKGCKHWDKTWTNDWAEGYHYCPMVDGIRKVDFYCADAESREDE